MKPCNFAQHDSAWRCVDCGRVVRVASARPPFAACRRNGRGLGDMVADGLSAVGITKERVEALTRTEGKPGGCGCAGRQKWLNEAGNKVQTDARNALIAAKKFYVGD